MTANSTASTYSLCNTDQIIQTLNDANPTFWIGCDDDGLQTFYYRTKPATATGTVTVTREYFQGDEDMREENVLLTYHS